jgi:hypothetical protein
MEGKELEISRVLKGFLVAPLTPCLIWAVIVLNPAILIFAIPVSYLCALVVGLPIYLILTKINKLNIFSVLVGSVIAGGVPSLILMALEAESLRQLLTPHYMQSFALFSLFGLIAGLVFWIIAIKESKSNNALKQGRAKNARPLA